MEPQTPQEMGVRHWRCRHGRSRTRISAFVRSRRPVAVHPRRGHVGRADAVGGAVRAAVPPSARRFRGSARRASTIAGRLWQDGASCSGFWIAAPPRWPVTPTQSAAASAAASPGRLVAALFLRPATCRSMLRGSSPPNGLWRSVGTLICSCGMRRLALEERQSSRRTALGNRTGSPSRRRSNSDRIPSPEKVDRLHFKAVPTHGLVRCAGDDHVDFRSRQLPLE